MKVLRTLAFALVTLALVLAACAPAPTEAPVVTEAPATEAPTEEATEAPTEEATEEAVAETVEEIEAPPPPPTGASATPNSPRPDSQPSP